MSTKHKDYYEILGVGKNATAKEIKSAFRKLARRYHPDANPGNPEAEERFKEINEAYEVLGDEKKRATYDQQGRYFSEGTAGGQWGGFDAGGFEFDLGNLFGGAGGFASNAPQKGDDLIYNAHLTFDESLKGKEVSLSIERDLACDRCSGSGAEPGTSISTCPTCGGTGRISANQGFFSMAQTCPSCRGRGRIASNPCKACGGAGRQMRSVVEKLKIPAGVSDGNKLKFKGKGQPGKNGGPAGDLFVVAKVSAHRYFKRNGADILIDLPLTFSEAALGASVEIPTVDGSVALKIPPGTQSGRTFRLKGKGATRLKGSGRGDMLATVRVEIPDELSGEERELIARLAKLTKENPRDKAFS